MDNKALKARLAVALAPGLSLRAWQGIAQKGLSAEEFIAGGINLWQSMALKPHTIEYLTALPWPLIDECIAWQSNPHCHICFSEDVLYPELLKTIQAPPKLLFLQGRSELLHRPQLAIVGSRNPTAAGTEWARHFARELAALGWVITSGLAQGIDGAAHRGALDAKGQTIAVLGTGLKRIYPQRHQRLSEEILQKTGLFVSEYPPSTPPLAQYFPARNRIISGLAVGVLVIEATLQSGSLITARFALQEGRQVYALPGSLHNPLSKGCHFLIKEGAKLVETIDDILEETAGFASWYSAKIDPKKAVKDQKDAVLDKKAQDLLNSVDFSPTSFDAILMRTGLTVTEVSVILMALELKGLIRIQSGGYERMS